MTDEPTLAAIRRQGGAEGVRSAILGVLMAYRRADGSVDKAGAAKHLGTTARALQAAAARAGVAWPVQPRGRPRKAIGEAGE